MAEPTQTCTTCGRQEVVRPSGRGFPPDIAKRRLAKACRAAGHTSTPRYRAGLGPRLATMGQIAPLNAEEESRGD